MNSGPYVDHDAQEYRDGPVTRGDCRLCGYPIPLCDCPPSWHAEPRDPATAIIGWWPTAIFAVFALAIAIVAVRVL